MLSDLHWGHKNIIKYRREFETPQQHDEYILDNILSTVTKRDTLWLLGDICFDYSGLEKILKVGRLVNSLHLILGNHDTDSTRRQSLIKTLMSCSDVSSVHSLYKYKHTWLSHAPIHPDELRGKYNIHGHTHGHLIDDPRYANVCCEHVGYTPINYQEVLGRLKNELP